MPASLAWSIGLTRSPSPGRLGLGCRAVGRGGRGSFMGDLVHLGRGEPARVEILADAVEVLRRIAVGREAAELAVDRVPRADLDLTVVDAGVEAVERADRRAARDLAVEVVHAAVARAHEALGGVDVPHRAAQVHAARRDGDELLLVPAG